MSEGLREAVETSMNDIGLGTPERIERARVRLTAWAVEFLNGLSFNEPTLKAAGWAERRGPDLADSILAALSGDRPDDLFGMLMADAVRHVSNREAFKFVNVDWTALGAALVGEYMSARVRLRKEKR